MLNLLPRLYVYALWGMLIWTESICGQNKIRVEAKFDPPAITLSRTSTYKVSIYGSQQSATPALPQIQGLVMSKSPRMLRSASFINGVPAVKMEYSYGVKPTQVGSYSVPPWSLEIEGATYQVISSSLRVLPPSEEDLLREQVRKKQEADFRQALFLELSIPKGQLFVGQTIVGSLDLHILDRLPVTSLSQLPQKLGDAFSQSNIRQPIEKRNVPKNGRNYVVYSWPIALTAVMEGKHELQYRMGVRVRLRRQTNPILRDPFLSDPFFGFGHEEAVTINSQKHLIEISSLPMKNRPKSFRGAVGKFETQTQTDATRVTVGDPVKVTFSVRGEGNFGVMPAPAIPETEKLKAGPAAFHFEGDENLKFKGTQKFEYVVTALRPGQVEIPAIPFSFFDPERQEYAIAETKAKAIRVEAWVDPSPTPTTTLAVRKAVTNRKFFQTESNPGEWRESLEMVGTTRTPSFWYAQIAPLTAILLLLGWQVREHQSSRNSVAKQIAILRREIKTATRNKDLPSLFQATRQVLRIQVGDLIKHERPEALSTDEVLEILTQRNLSPETISLVKELLETADTQEFAADQNADFNLNDWAVKAKRSLKRIRSES